MTNDKTSQLAEKIESIRGEYADEEAEAAEAEIAERNASLDVPLNLRIDKELDAQLRQRATAAEIPISALVRRLLREATARPEPKTLTEEQVEEIARRVLNEAR